MAKARYSMGTHSVGSVQYDAVMTPLVHVQACLEHTRPSSYSELLPYDQRHERERECADVVTSDDGDGVMSDGDSGMGDGGKVDGDDGSTKPLPVWFCKRLEFSLERITPSMPQRVRGEGEGEGEEGEGGKSSSLRRRRTGMCVCVCVFCVCVCVYMCALRVCVECLCVYVCRMSACVLCVCTQERSECIGTIALYW